MGINQRYDIVNLKWIFANNLRSFRFENGQKKYTQETMSERLGLKQKTYNSYENENDSKMPPIRKIIELCNKLDVGLDDMLTSTEVNAGPHFQSTETEGMSDYLTEAQTRSVKRAVSNILRMVQLQYPVDYLVIFPSQKRRCRRFSKQHRGLLEYTAAKVPQIRHMETAIPV